MAKYKREVTEYIVDHIDIVDVIGSTVSLKKAGRNYKGLCPFHSEKTPSFVVSQEKQFFHCFGCGKSGSIIGFVMETENIGFLDALETLAERYRLDLTPFIIDDGGKKRYDNTAKLYTIMKQVARYYYKQLSAQPAALQYVEKRGIDSAVARAFGLGYAPDAWDEIIKFATRSGYSYRDMLDCGLILKNDQSRYYDRFRNRLMFPIFDRRGRVVAFGGRVLDDALPKYLNSPETIIFHKSNVLYGLNFARKHVNDRKSVILVEGYMDVITLHQYGYKNTVASLGTALTEHHVKQLDSIYDEVIFAYDGDAAGRSAIMKSLAVFKGTNLKIKIIEMGDYKDPDEVLKHSGTDGFASLIENAKDTMTFSLDYIQRDYDITIPDGRLAFLKAMFQYIYDLQSRSERQIFIEKLAERLKLNVESVTYDYKNWHAKQRKKKQYNRSIDISLDEDNAIQFSALQENSQLFRIEQALLFGLVEGVVDITKFKSKIEKLYYAQLNELLETLEIYYREHQVFDLEQAIAELSLEQLRLIEAIKKLTIDWQENNTFAKLSFSHRKLLLVEARRDIDAKIEKYRIMSGENAKLQLRELLVKRANIQSELAQLNKQSAREK